MFSISESFYLYTLQCISSKNLQFVIIIIWMRDGSPSRIESFLEISSHLFEIGHQNMIHQCLRIILITFMNLVLSINLLESSLLWTWWIHVKVCLPLVIGPCLVQNSWKFENMQNKFWAMSDCLSNFLFLYSLYYVIFLFGKHLFYVRYAWISVDQMKST